MKKNKTIIVKWVWKDTFLRYQRSIKRNFILNIFCVLCQYSSYGLLFFYVNTLEKKEIINLGGVEINPSNSIPLFCVITLCVGFFFFMAGVVNYFAKIQMIELAEKHEKFCDHRILLKINDLPSPELILSYPILSKKNILKAVFKDSRKLGQLLRLFSKGMMLIIKWFASICFLLYLSIPLTFFILLLSFLALLYYFKNNKEVVQQTNTVEQSKSQFIKLKKEYILEAIQNKHKTTFSQKLIERDKSKVIKKQYEGIYGILRNKEKNNLVTNILTSVSIIGILGISGSLVLFSQITTWAILVGYVVGLKFFLNALSSVQGLFDKLSKNYDYIANYKIILDTLATVSKETKKMELHEIEACKIAFSTVKDDDDDDDDDDDE